MFLLVILLLAVGVRAYENDSCVQQYNPGTQRGFVFANCSDATVGFQWKKTKTLWTTFDTQTKNVLKFNLTVNDRCSLSFEGREGLDRYGKWTDKKGKVTNCRHIVTCMLELDRKGNLMTGDGQNVCKNERVRVEINDQWSWTKIRVADLPAGCKFKIWIAKTKDSEEAEYTTSTITTTMKYENFTVD